MPFTYFEFLAELVSGLRDGSGAGRGGREVTVIWLCQAVNQSEGAGRHEAVAVKVEVDRFRSRA